MKKRTAVILSCILPLILNNPAIAEEIPDGYTFTVEIVGGYSLPAQEPSARSNPAESKTTTLPESENAQKSNDKYAFDYTLEEFAKIFTEETNAIREEHGLPAFETDDLLTEMAQARKDESTKIDHIRPDGTTPGTIFEEYNAPLRCTGENVMGAGPSPENAARGFLDSQGHKRNILNPDAKYMGVGVKWVDTVVGPRIAVLQLFAANE